MRGRIARAAVVVAMVGAVFAVQGAPMVGADEGDNPVGYSIGSIQHGAGALGGCNFYKIDLHTGAATQLNVGNGSVKCGDGLTYDDDGTLYAYIQRVIAGGGSTVSELVTIDKHTGVQHVVGQLPNVLVGGGGMTFDADGDLWLYGLVVNDARCTPNGTYCLYEINKKTAAAEFVGAAPTGVGVFGLAADCEDVLAITATGFAGVGPARPAPAPPALAEVDTGNGALHVQVATPGIFFPTGLDFDDENDLWAIGNTASGGAGIGMTLYRVNPNNGNTGPTDITFNGAPFSGQLNGLAVSRLSCEDPETPTTAPPAPVVAAEPAFTG